MNNELKLMEVASIDQPLLEELSNLLIDVVEDGASVGFLPPLSKDEAASYWAQVLDPSVVLWIARLDGQLCGTVQLQLATKANGIHRAEVAKLMVDQKQRRHGIGRALMNNLESRAKEEGRSLLVLDTRAGDPSNLLYKSLGYIEVGVIPEFAISATGEKDGTVFYYKLV